MHVFVYVSLCNRFRLIVKHMSNQKVKSIRKTAKLSRQTLNHTKQNKDEWRNRVCGWHWTSESMTPPFHVFEGSMLSLPQESSTVMGGPEINMKLIVCGPPFVKNDPHPCAQFTPTPKH